MNSHMKAHKVRGRWGEWLIAGMLIFFVVIVAFWEIMSSRSRRLFQPFQVNASDFESFAPGSPAWRVRALPVRPDPIEPNILAYAVSSAAGANHNRQIVDRGSAIVRLVHGYNMVDCMRIKGYQVELIRDNRQEPGSDGRGHDAERFLPSGCNKGVGPADRAEDRSVEGGDQGAGRWIQVWRLVSGAGDVSIWVTSMIRVGDFVQTDIDLRSMAFPRVGVADDPAWLPRGLTLKSLRDPVKNFRLLMRKKWNNARCDLATFLKLRQPAWASDDLLTLVTAFRGASVKPDEEEAVVEQVVAAHEFIYCELVGWRSGHEEAGDETSKLSR